MKSFSALLLTLFIASAHAAPGDKVVAFNGNLKADKIQPGNKIFVDCQIRDQTNNVVGSMGQYIGTAGADGTFTGPYTVNVNVPAASLASAKITNWRCMVDQGPPNGGTTFVQGGAAPQVQGNF